MSTKVTPNGQSYNMTYTITLDPYLVSRWLQNSGLYNYGLLIRARKTSGWSINVLSSICTVMANRPALRILYSTTKSQPIISYPVNYTYTPRIIWVNGSGGSDYYGIGTARYPYASPAKALFVVAPGDSIFLTNGIYAGGLTINVNNVTLQSAPNNWAVISSPLSDPITSNNVIIVRPGIRYGVIRNLEICGGYYYGIMLWSLWGSYGQYQDIMRAEASGNYLIEGVRIHDTGSSAIKMTMKVSNIIIRDSEIYHAGKYKMCFKTFSRRLLYHFINDYLNSVHRCSGRRIRPWNRFMSK